MRRGSSVLTLAVVGVFVLLCAPLSAQSYSRHGSGVQVDVGVFYDGLAPYGDWVEMPDYGWSWAPRVERGWRPYTRGQWVMTDDGWFWDSDEQFGWAAYHYGRWINDPYYGWVWVPGTEWAPAWVSWRHGNGYTGWAPLPPRAAWQTHVGLSIGVLDIDAFIGADDYSFVHDRAFVDRGVYQRVLPPTQNVTIINVTNNVTNYTVVNQRVVNGGIAVANVERAAGRRVPRARTVDMDRADGPRRGRADEVAIFRPQVRMAPEKRPGHGRSLVEGDEPPARLVERRREREQERQQRGNGPELTAKDVEQRRGGDSRGNGRHAAGQSQAPPPDARAQQQEAQRQRDQARQDADTQQAAAQEQQRLNRERRQATDQQQQQRDRTRQDADTQRAVDQEQRRLNREKQATDQQQRERALQDASKQRATAQEQQRLDREKRQAIDQQQRRDQMRQDADKQHAAAQEQQRGRRDADAQAQNEKRAKPPQETKDTAKNRGKKNPKASPASPPPAQQQ
jgi:hypothetical protein